jgi:Aspartyl protease
MLRYSGGVDSRRLLAALLILISTAGPTRAANNKNCPPLQLASVDIAIAGATLVPVTLGDQPAWLALETDAAMTFLHQDAINSLHLPTRALEKDAIQVSLGGRRVTQAASFKPMQLGSLGFSRTEFLVDPFPHPSPSYEGRLVAGSLAMDLLWPYDLELDLAKKKLTLYSSGNCAGAAVTWSKHYGRIPMDFTAVGDFYFTVEIDGKKLETSIATSRESSQMTVDVSRLLSSSDGTNTPGQVLTRVVRLAAGDLVIPDKIQLTEAPQQCELSSAGRPDGSLGYDRCYGRFPLVLGRSALRNLHLYFATKEKVIYFTVADVQ